MIYTLLAVLVAVAGAYTEGSEILENGTWKDIGKAPTADGFRLHNYAVIYNGGHHYYFGGDGYDTILALQENTWNWSNAGKMNSARKYHGVILVGDRFMVIGGSGDKNEACQLKNGLFNCTEYASNMKDYNKYRVVQKL